MSVFKKYVKKKVVVAAKQVTVAGDYGILGTLSVGDWILNTADGELHVMSDVDFQAKYELTSDTESVQGADWN